METNQSLIDSLMDHLSSNLPELDASINTHINSGGCGIFARLLSNKLKELNVPHTIVYYAWDNDVNSKINDSMNGKPVDLTMAVPSHILIKIKDNYFDSEGEVSAKTAFRPIGEMSYELLERLISEGSWNYVFDRAFIPAISRKLNSIFDTFNS